MIIASSAFTYTYYYFSRYVIDLQSRNTSVVKYIKDKIRQRLINFESPCLDRANHSIIS